MSKLIFKESHFPINRDHAITHEGAVVYAQKAFDEWLEKQTVVYGYGANDGWGWRNDSTNGETKKAYVVCIEPIRKCEHKRVAARVTDVMSYYCLDCNKELKPKNGWSVVE